ncbi:hypothetical protein [Hymenobacter swuensis]|uniref:hypothetical protein n=1 Tax=Hymenobacter swuensis TaxID=1446467 RepID=UPI0005C51691|nr:hypothetical protein [Hymenobacter swuensis]
MKKLFYAMNCLLMLSSSPSWAVGEDPSVIIVRSLERNGANSRLIIYRSKDRVEEIEYQSGLNDKGIRSTAAAYQQVVMKLMGEGYVLQTMTHSDLEASSTFIFVKAPKP